MSTHTATQLTLHGLPAEPARLERGQLVDSSLSLVRQLEHRIDQLPALAGRLEEQRDQALREAAAGREQLARPFKYEQQLTTASQQQQEIERTLAERHTLPVGQPEPPEAEPEHSTIEPETAESLRLLRATQSRPVEDALRTPPVAPAASHRPASLPSPRARPRR